MKNLLIGMGLVGISSILTLMSGCASSPYQAKEVDTEIQPKGYIQNAVIGLNTKQEIVVQEETQVDIVLRKVRWENYDLERVAVDEHEHLSQCRSELADPRLGGSGVVQDLPEVDVPTPSELKEELGLTKNGSLVIVKKEMFQDVLLRERALGKTLQSQGKLLKKYRMKCEQEMGVARVKHGLPANRIQAEGHYEGATYVMTRRPEHNLDEAFQLSPVEVKADATE